MTTFIIAAVTGVFIGLISGLLGVGGGMIMVPVFRLAFGLSPVVSTATSLFAIIPTSVSGAVTHIRGKTCILKLGIALGIGGAITSPLGAWLANSSPGWLVMFATALVIGYSSVTMFRKALKAPRTSKGAASAAADAAVAADAGASGGAGATHPTTPPDASSATNPSSTGTSPTDPSTGQFVFDATPANVAKGIGIGLVTGVASGYVGLGGGFIMIPLMMTLFNMNMKQTSGTSLIAIMMLALPGTIMQSVLGNVDYLVGIAICCGSIPGALVGAKLVPYTPERTLRFIFAGFLCISSVLLVARELGLLG